MKIHTQHRSFSRIVLLLIVLVCVGAIGYMTLVSVPATAPRKNKVVNQNQPASEKTTPKEFNKSQFSIDEPGSLWWIVNKNRPVGESYKPADLVTPDIPLNTQKTAEENQIRAHVAPYLKSLFSGAQNEGISFFLASGYRSFSLQQAYYSNYVRTSGQMEADRFSARPGTSEHQTGLSLDVATVDRIHYLDQAFGQDIGGKWLATHAHEHGFIVRYPDGKESVTGYMYEPWHIRFVGKELASRLYNSNQTMEEFFAL